MEYIRAISRADVVFCGEAILQFRPNLNRDNFVDEILEMIEKDGFNLIFVPTPDNTKAAAFTGYRTMKMLRTGKIIYIDDLFTLPECRGKGYAGALLDRVTAQAKLADIQAIHLDSGYTLYDAHRLYLNKGYILACNHFAKKIG